MDDLNITMEEYIRLEEEKARRHSRRFNWQTATFGKVKNYDDEDDYPIDFETEFPAIVFGNTLTTIPSEPTVCPPNKNKVDFRISLDESDDEDYTIIFDENPFSNKIISVNDLKKTSSGNDRPLSPNPTVDYFDGLDYFKDFKNEFPTIFYNDGLTSKSDLGIKPLINSECIDEFNLIDETSLSEYDEKVVSRFNDLFNDNHPNDLKSEKDDDDNNIGIHIRRINLMSDTPYQTNPHMAYRAWGQAPEKVTGVDLFYLRSMDRGTTNVPYLLAHYLFMHAKGRKSKARLSGGHFIGRLAMHFGLVSDEGLRGLQAAAAGANEADEGSPAAEEVAPEIPAPVQAPPPPPPAPQPRTMSQRIERL
ncbi:hypothetical protein Tco_1366418 [Tanacetum coccineum]